MRGHDHPALPTAAAVALYPFLRRTALTPWAANLLRDVDHFAWYCITRRSFSYIDAVRFIKLPQPPQRIGIRYRYSLQAPVAPGLARSWRRTWWRGLRLTVVGLLLQVGLYMLRLLHGLRKTRSAMRSWSGVTRPASYARRRTNQWSHTSGVGWELLPSYSAGALAIRCGAGYTKAHCFYPAFVRHALVQMKEERTHED